MPELDMRTVSFLVSFFSFTFGVGLLFFHFEQKYYNGIKYIALALVCISLSVGLISLRGYIPVWTSIIVSNMLLCGAMTLSLYGFSVYRESNILFFKLSLFGLLPLFTALLYYLFSEPSINMRATAVSTHLGMTQLFTCIVLYQGKAIDSRLPTNTLSLAFGLVSVSMFARAIMVLNIDDPNHYMQAGWVHQIPYLTSMFLIMAMSFNSVWLVNGRLTRSIEALSIRDNLTSLYNRRGMDKVTPQLAINKSTEHRPLAAMMCDIDHFKSINDKFGHQAGDEVIIKVADQIRHHLRAHDIAIRYGGEEFLILLPKTTLPEAVMVAERVRKAVHMIPAVREDMLPISISIGVSMLQKEQDLNSLISESDSALYQAKQQGRNCVIVAPNQESKTILMQV